MGDQSLNYEFREDLRNALGHGHTVPIEDLTAFGKLAARVLLEGKNAEALNKSNPL